MKRFKYNRPHLHLMKYILCIALICVLLVATGCSTVQRIPPTHLDEGNYTTTQPDKLAGTNVDTNTSISSQSQYINANNAFGYRMLDLLPASENQFFSPFSMLQVLDVVYSGADGSTKQEIQNALQLPSQEQTASFSAHVHNILVSQNYTFTDANALWIDDKFNINQSFVNQAQSKFGAQIFPVNFTSAQKTADKINTWTSQNTQGLIQQIVTAENIKDLQLGISNAVYFLGEWNKKFDKADTHDAQFYVTPNQPVTKKFMDDTRYVPYFEDNNVQIIDLDFVGNATMRIYLPKNQATQTLNISNYAQQNLTQTEVRVQFPKFKFQTSYENLVPQLQSLGLIETTTGGNFAKITTDNPMKLSVFIHKAYIELDEERVVAAASTSGGMKVGMAAPKQVPQFVADHPFVFEIIDKNTNATLFMGRIVNPVQN